MDQRLMSARQTLTTSLTAHEWQRWDEHMMHWPARMREALIVAREQ